MCEETVLDEGEDVLPPSALPLELFSSARRSALSPYGNIQVTMTMSGRSRHLVSHAKECEERKLKWRRLKLRPWSIVMSCMLKSREMKRLNAALTSATACIMSR